jgi:drug/metabolite transporter (DMT)-like permease
MEKTRNEQLKADLSLLMVTFIWGTTFVVVKNAIADMPTFRFIAIRFAVACLFLVLISSRKLKQLNKKTALAGLLIGMLLFGGYSFQTLGLQYTSASNAGFITGLAVVLVPFMSTLLTRRPPGLFTILGVLSATLGLALLTLGTSFSLNKGDLLEFLCAVCFCLHILAVGKFAPDMDATLLAIVQIGTVAISAGFLSLGVESQPWVFSEVVWIGLLLTAIPATSLAFLIQTKMQKFTTTTRTAIIFTMEPVFAALFAFLVAGERLTMQGKIGAALVICGMLLSELKLGKKHVEEATL